MSRIVATCLLVVISGCSQEPNFIFDEPRECEDCEDGGSNTTDFGREDMAGDTDTTLVDMRSAQPDMATAEWCPDPGDPARFARWSNGISASVSHDRSFETAGETISSGIGIFDLDSDGDNDVIVTSQGSTLIYFENDGDGNFTDATSSAGLDGLTLTTSVSGADIDGDGDTDLLIGRTTGAYLLINDSGSFTDEAMQRGLFDPDDVVSGASFADFDGDGDLDVYITSYHPPLNPMDTTLPTLRNRLLRNDDGSFNEITISPGGEATKGMTLASAWWDWDEDGRPDLWVAEDFGVVHGPNKLFRNLGPDPEDADGWLFEDIAGQTGLDAKVFSMSATLADFDNDGDRDGYVTNMANNVFHVRDGDRVSDEAVTLGVTAGTTDNPEALAMGEPNYASGLEGIDEFFANYADPSSGLHTVTSWNAIFFDADHDGWQDLFVANGPVLTTVMPEARRQPNSFFVGDEGGSFSEAPCWFLPDKMGASRGAAVGDLDGDGDLDLVWSNNGDAGEGGVYAARNDFSDGNWLIVELEGQAPNTDAIGAKITLTAGDLTQTRWIDGGQGFMSVSERVAHFGLADADAIDSLIVEWPNGSTQDVEVDAINQRIVINE